MAKRFFLGLVFSVVLSLSVPFLAFAVTPPQAPDTEGLSSEQANVLIGDYNAAVDAYNEAAINEYNQTVEDVNKQNAEINAYNTQIDVDYNKAVQETNEKNAEIDKHNAAEEQRVSDQEAANQKAVEDAEKANAEIDEKNAAEKERVDAANQAAQEQYENALAQYDADYAQYQKDKAMEERIIAAGYSSVEQYNNMIVTRYNNPANASVEKNANATEISIDDTYIVTEGTEKSGRLIPVHIEHNFLEVGLSYVKDFYIDAKDSIMLLSIGALVETTQPGYACFYYKTDDVYSMGYWISAGSTLYFYPSAYVEDGWNCGDTHFLTYKDSTNEYVWPNEDIYIIYDYMWQPLRVYKTYNVPVEPTEPTLELEEYVEIPYIEPEIIEVVPADIWEKVLAPVKEAYKQLLDYPVKPGMLEKIALLPVEEVVIDNTVPAAAQPDIVQPATPVTNVDYGTGSVVTPAVNVIADDAVPAASGRDSDSSQTTIDDDATPLAPGSPVAHWALVNLILMIINILLLLFIPRRRKEEEENEEQIVYHKKRNNILVVAFAVAAVIAFILTENVYLPMVLVDQWTILMAALCGGGIIAKIFTRNKKEEKEVPQE